MKAATGNRQLTPLMDGVLVAIPRFLLHELLHVCLRTSFRQDDFGEVPSFFLPTKSNR